MTTKINGRTLEEIKKGLKCCGTSASTCDVCPYEGECHLPFGSDPESDALALIDQLERERDEARREAKARRAANKLLRDALDTALRERDAAVEDIMLAVCDDLKCSTCMYKGNESHMCDDCDVHTFCNWQWRGVQEVERCLIEQNDK